MEITNFNAFTVYSNQSPFGFYATAPAEVDIHLRCSYAEATDIAKAAIDDGIDVVKITPLSADAENLDAKTMFALDFYGDAVHDTSMKRIVMFLRNKSLLEQDENNHYKNIDIIVGTNSSMFSHSSNEASVQFVKLSTYMDIFDGKIL